jgi:hypothetical protein
MADLVVVGIRHIAVAAMVCVACSSSSTRVITESADSTALQHLKTFALRAPTPDASQITVAGTNNSDRVAGAVMDMDPMLATSLVGKAIQQELATAFAKRGYQGSEISPDFYIAYYAGTGRVVDTRGSGKAYHVGQKITTETYEYPAGTIVVDVVNAKSDSLVWRGIGVSEIPNDPKDYARAVQSTVNKIVAQFPKAT